MASKDEKIGGAKTMRALHFWHGINSAALKHMSLDLSARQNAVLLSVYLEPGPHSIKTLADELDISKPAICRAIDVLEQAKLVKRARDRNDKRNVMIARTPKGTSYLSEFADLILAASKEAA